MKKISFVFAFLLTATLSFAQMGYNSGAHGPRGNVGVNEYRGGNQGASNRYYGGNQNYRGGQRGVVRGGQRGNVRYGSTTTFRGGVVNAACPAPRQRIRWEYSPCGTYKYRITERCNYNQGGWVWVNGCRRWSEPTWSAWHVVCRDRIVIRGW